MPIKCSHLGAVAFAIFLTQPTHAATLTGGEGPDTITGTSLDDVIDGRGGNDTIYGNDGDDNIVSGGGNDSVWGGYGNDTIVGNQTAGDGSDTVYGESGNDTLTNVDNGYAYGGDGNDTFNFSGSVLFASGGPGDDLFSGGIVSGVLSGDAGNDVINAWTQGWRSNFVDPIPTPGTILGGDGDDVVNAAGNICVNTNEILIDGGYGYDEFVFQKTLAYYMTPTCHDYFLNTRNFEKFTLKGAQSWINGPEGMNAFTDQVIPPGIQFEIDMLPYPYSFGATEDNNIDASAETDARILFRSIYNPATVGPTNNIPPAANIVGGQQDDIFIADKGVGNNDFFKGEAGNDYMDGGDGIDTAVFSGAQADYSVNEVAYNTFTITDTRPGSPDGTDTVSDVNKLQFADQTVDVIIRGLHIVGDDYPNTLYGTPEADLIDGKGADDFLNGGAGNDTALGGSGNDIVVGGLGSDVINGGDGSDAASYADASSGVTASLQAPGANSGNAAGDSYVSVENLFGSPSGDNLTGDAGSNIIEGGGGGDTLAGGDGNDILNGGGGYLASSTISVMPARMMASLAVAAVSPEDDTLIGGKGNDTINGGDGTDTAVFAGNFGDYMVSYSASSQRFTVTDAVPGRDGVDSASGVEYFQFADGTQLASNLMTNKINGTDAADKLIGGPDDDELRGLGGNDTLLGNAGNDLLDGGAGADMMTGGNGDDSYVVDNPGDKVKEGAKAGSGYDTVYTSLSSFILPANVEALVYTGEGPFSGKGNKSGNRMTGGPASDRLDGQKGADVMIGLRGDDTYVVDSPADLVNEEPGGGYDTVTSGVTITTLAVNVEVLNLTKGSISGRGNELDNYILGSSGNNTLEGGDGADLLNGGMGNDIFYGETMAASGNDRDTISYSGSKKGVTFSLLNTSASQSTGGAGTDRIFDVSGIEDLTGSSFNDFVTGNTVVNIIHGGDGDDVINGLTGADILYGDAGTDMIDCGADTDIDRIALVNPAHSPPGAGRDQVTSFSSGYDVLVLQEMDANINLPGLQSFQFSDTIPASHSVWYAVSGSDAVVSGDINADAVADFEILLLGVSALQVRDFVLQ